MKSRKKKVTSDAAVFPDQPQIPTFEGLITDNLVGLKDEETTTKKRTRKVHEEEFGGILSSAFNNKDF